MVNLIADWFHSGIQSWYLLWYRPERELKKILPELEELVDKLKKAAKHPDRLSSLIVFMKLVSDWQVRQELAHLHYLFEMVRADDDRAECLESLNMRFRLMGRGKDEIYDCRYIGEPFSEAKLCIGGEYGLPYRSVVEWKLLADEPAPPLSHMGLEGKRPYSVVSEQARRFMAREFCIIEECVARLVDKPGDRLKYVDAQIPKPAGRFGPVT